MELNENDSEAEGFEDSGQESEYESDTSDSPDNDRLISGDNSDDEGHEVLDERQDNHNDEGQYRRHQNIYAWKNIKIQLKSERLCTVVNFKN